MKDKVMLLVEDNPDDVELTRRAFAKNNLANRLLVISDGVEAMHYLLDAANGKADTPLPTVILLDLKLAKLSGLEILQKIRSHERLKRLPVVILTSSKEQQDVIRSYDLGANSYIRKPVDFDQFVEAVRHLGLYWLLLNEPPITH